MMDGRGWFDVQTRGTTGVPEYTSHFNSSTEIDKGIAQVAVGDCERDAGNALCQLMSDRLDRAREREHTLFDDSQHPCVYAYM